MRLLLTFLLCSTWMIGQSKISDNQIRTPPPLQCSDTSGSGTTQTCTTAPSFTPAAKDCVTYNTTTTNTGALTLNVNSSSAAPVKKWLGTALVAGDVVANKPQLTCYDGTNWQLSTIGNAPSTGNVTAAGTLTSHGVVLGAGTSAVGVTAVGTTGQVLTGVTSSDPVWGAAASTTTPTVEYKQCSAVATSGNVASLACSSSVNTATGDFLIAICAGFGSSGTSTITFADAGNTWTSIGNYSDPTDTFQANAFWTSVTSTGARTFTCSFSPSINFDVIEVMKINGANATTPVDAATVGNRGGATTGALTGSITTTSSDIAIYFEYSGSGSTPTSTVPGGNFYSSAASPDYLLYTKYILFPGTYKLQANGGSRTWQNITFALKP